MALLMTALDIALEHDKPSAALRAYNNLADLTQNADRYAEATRFIDQGLDLARRVGNRYWESILLGFAYPRFAQGRWDEAVAMMGELPADWFSHLRAAFCQGYVATGVMLKVHRGDLEGAAIHLERFTVLESSADLQERTEYEIAKADLLLARGDASGALRSAEEAMEGKRSLSLGDHRVKESVVTAVEAALLLGDLTKAEGLLDVFRSLPPGRRTPFHLAHAMRLGAKLTVARGEQADVEAGFKGSVGLFREMAFPFWMAVALLEYGEWLAAQDRTADAAPLVEEARSIFEGLGARPWVDRAALVAQDLTVTS